MTLPFRSMIEARWEAGLFLCVGLDPDIEKMPVSARTAGTRESLLNFNKAIIDATHDLVCAYKPNIAFYERHGDQGWDALRSTIAYIGEMAPEVPVILDAKRGDNANTNEAYASAVFDHLRAHAVTVQPYLGRESLRPFLERKDKGIFVVCRSSNPGAGEIQDLKVEGVPLYQVIARIIAKEWDTGGNCGLVIGATYPDELRAVRGIVGDMPILIPGIGTQNGDLQKSVQFGKDRKSGGMIISVSRAVLYASSADDFADAARKKALDYSKQIQTALG